MKEENRDKLFPGPVRFGDLLNNRYISRKSIYDFCVKNSSFIRGRCLDFGCGSMQYKGVFGNADSIIGLDVAGADQLFGYNEDIVYYDGKDIPFEQETFDSAYSIQAFPCIDDYAYSLRELHRVIKLGGYLLLTTAFAYPELSNLPDYNRFTVERITSDLNNNGFDIIELKGSTSTIDSIRRFRIFYLQYETRIPPIIRKLYTVFANTSYIISRREWNGGSMPIDYMILCKKVENPNDMHSKNC